MKKPTGRPPYRAILAAIAASVRDTGLRVGDLPTTIACWISDDDGDDLGPGVICRLVTGEYVHWWNNDRVELRGAVRIAAYAR
jgi:hypothetical protein